MNEQELTELLQRYRVADHEADVAYNEFMGADDDHTEAAEAAYKSALAVRSGVMSAIVEALCKERGI